MTTQFCKEKPSFHTGDMECMDLNQIQPQGKQTAWVVHCAPVATCIVLANWSGI